MSIVRVAKNNNYVVMNRTALNDNRLSWKAKGIMAYLLSMPDDWVFYMDELVTHAADGRDSFRSGFKELKDAGYVERRAIKDEQTKKIISWETIVHEVPIEPVTEKPHTDIPQMEKPLVENPTLLSIDNNQVLNKPNTDIPDDDDPLRFYMENVRYNLNPFEIETVEHWEKEYPRELVIEAIKRSALASATSVKYTESILINWQKKRITTLAEVERDDAAFEQRKGGRQSNGGSKHNNKPNYGYKADLGF